MTKKGNTFEVKLPHTREICPTCDGKGSHVNRNIDGNGISPEEFAEDPEFEEAYFEGRYDVTCEECKGEKIVPQVAWDMLTPKMQDRLQRQLDSEAADRREADYERKYCV